MWGVSYWVFPVISGCMWLAMLMAMLIIWAAVDHRPHYEWMGDNQSIAYISDVGASSKQPLFIGGCVVTSIFLDLSFASERWLRHRGRLAPNTTMAEKILSGLSMVFAAIGTVGLICLSIFNDHYHDRLHDIFLLLFIAGYVISAIFICAEYQRLGVHFRQHRILRISFWIKLFFIIVELILAIAFAATKFLNKYDAAAVLEWTVAFVFTFYVFSFFVDLIPAVHTKNHTSGATELEQEMNDADANESRKQHYGNGATGTTNGYGANNGNYTPATNY